jgi:hypothetical protein
MCAQGHPWVSADGISDFCRCGNRRDSDLHRGFEKPGDDKILEMMRKLRPGDAIPMDSLSQIQSLGKKFDEGKPQLSLVPKSLIWAVGTVLTFGAKKYGTDNWRRGLAWSRPYNALLRHLTAWWAGETVDAESGKSHLWHAATELAFLIEYEETNRGDDDRYKGH